MTCETARERMLEVDAAELTGEGTGPLARHLEGCPACARMAATLATELADLERAFEAFETADARAAADAALAASRPRPAGSPRSRRWPRWPWVPLAAAAALTAVLVTTRQPPMEVTDPDVAAPTAPRVAVTPPPDRAAAIMETANPDITIVWLYEREGS
jgi:anti-sigma factor RsiW